MASPVLRPQADPIRPPCATVVDAALRIVTADLATVAARTPISTLGGIVAFRERRVPVGAIDAVARMTSNPFNVSIDYDRRRVGEAQGVRSLAARRTRELN